MKIASLGREQLVEWLGGQIEPSRDRLTAKWYKHCKPGEVIVVWQDEANVLENALIAVPQEEIREFFAFVSTYVASYRPFSAFFKVIPYEALEKSLKRKEISDLSKRQFSQFISVALAEAFVHSRGKVKSLDDLTVQGVQATLSATLMSAVWKGYSSADLSYVTERWLRARKLLSDGPLGIEPQEILYVWEIISDSISPNQEKKSKISPTDTSKALRQGLSGSGSFTDWFVPFVQRALGNDESVKVLKGAREERIRSLPNLIEALRQTNADRSTVEFVAGGLLSMVGNGSMNQLRLVDFLSADLPKSALWFGVLSAFQSQRDALTAGNCLGRRVLRELLRPVTPFSPPGYDISFDELTVLGEKAIVGDAIRMEHGGTISVGLNDSVQAPFRRTAPKREIIDQLEIEERYRAEFEKIDQLRHLLDRAGYLARELQRPNQRELFDRDSQTSKRR